MKSQARYLGMSLALALLLLGGGWMLVNAEGPLSARAHDLPPGSIGEPLAPAGGPVLNLTLTPSDPFPTRGQTLTYTLVMSNTGDAPAAGALMTNTLPGGLTYVSDSLQATAGDVSYASDGATVHWQGDLAVDAPVTVTYAATLDTSDYVYNTAVLHHPDAEEDAGATSSPADPWGDPELLDRAHIFDEELGAWRTIAVDAEGVPHIAYAGDTGLHYATLSGTTWLTETVPGSGNYLADAALVLSDEGLARIAYRDGDELYLAEQVSATGSTGDLAQAPGALTWTVSLIAECGWSVETLDLQQGSDGTLHLVYDDRGTNSLYYTAGDAQGWSDPVEILTEDGVGGACDFDDGYALALDQDDVPHVACAYAGLPPRELRLYEYGDPAPWTTYVVVDDGDDFYNFPSLVYDGETPHLAFFRDGAALYHAERDGNWDVTAVDDVGGLYNPRGTTLAVNGGRLAIVSSQYEGRWPSTTTIRLASRPLTATTWGTDAVETFVADARPRASLALDEDGRAHLATYHAAKASLRYAVQNGSLALQTVDESRPMRSAAIAVDGEGAVHVAWHAKQLRYALSAVDATTWTQQIALPDPGMATPELSLAVDEARAPHLVYGQSDAPLRHATLQGGTWITRQIDAPGDVEVHPAIAAEEAGTAHVAYVARAGDDMVLRHAGFDGTDWVTETLDPVGPAGTPGSSPEQKPRLVAQDGTVYVLYADCTAHVDGADYAIDLVLQTWDGHAWSEETLDTFVGQCSIWDTVYHLDAGEEGQVAAFLSKPVVRSFRLEGSADASASGFHAAASPAAPENVTSPGTMPTSPSFWLLGDGWLSTIIEQGRRFIQQWTKEGVASERIVVGEDRYGTTLKDGDGKEGSSAIVETWWEENKLTVSRARRQPVADEPILTLGGGMGEEHLCPDEAAGQEKTVFNASLSVNPVTDWEALSILFRASGSGDDVADVESVRLYQGSTLLSSGAYPEDDGLISLTIGRRIPAGTTLNLRLVYVFKEDVDDCQQAVKAYAAETKVAWVNAEPVDTGAYPVYEKEPPTPVTGDPLTLACVWNANTDEPFELIQGAVDDADTADEHVINVCPGTYTENVEVDKSLTIQSMEGREVTIVQALAVDDDVFHVQKDDTSIIGFTIRASGGDDQCGIYVHGSTVRNCTITSNAVENARVGLFLDSAEGCRVSGNLVSGNKDDGIVLYGGARHTIGGFTEAARNVVSGNDGVGIQIRESDENRVEGNHIGTDASGTAALPNESHGIEVYVTGERNVIEDNLISGNKEHGVSFVGGGASSNEVLGNLIGCDKLGEQEVPNEGAGVSIDGAKWNTIGGSGIGDENLIKGNLQCGVLLDIGASDNTVRGNTISENLGPGVKFYGAERNTLDGNVISGNEEDGVLVDGACRNTITSNLIGTNETASLPHSNGGYGIHLVASHFVEAEENVIGGQSEEDRNVISGNARGGIFFEDSASLFLSGNRVIGNYIGTRGDGATYLRNAGPGVLIRGGVSNTLEANVISGNQGAGVELDGEWTRDYVVRENFIGTVKDGTAALPNLGPGVEIVDGARSNTVVENLISGNQEAGVRVHGEDTSGNVIRGNRIGTDASGGVALANLGGGIGVEHQTSIEGNTISGNGGVGITLAGDENEVVGNRVGTDQAGAQELGNDSEGLLITGSENVVEDNTVSANGGCGVKLYVFDGAVTKNEIRSNLIGTDTSGDASLPNEGGVCLGNGASHNQIGGSATAGEGNTIAGNHVGGVLIQGSPSNYVLGNRIGTADGSTALANEGPGVSLDNAAHTLIGSRNVIRFNAEAGIYLEDARYVEIYDSDISQNEANGVEAKASDNYTIDGNQINGNALSGIQVYDSDAGRIASNGVVSNCKGIYLVESFGTMVSGNDIRSNTCSTAIHLDGSDGDVAGNLIRDDASDAVHCKNGASPAVYKNIIDGNGGNGVLTESGAAPLIHHNNLSDNDGYGVRNDDAAVTISARANWWGSAAGPDAGDGVSGNVDHGDWLDQAVDVVVVAEQDLLEIAAGSGGSNKVVLNNLAVPSDTLTVVVTDTLGWLSGAEAFTVTLAGELGARTAISVTVPGDAAIGAMNEVRVRAVSQGDPTAEDADIFHVRATGGREVYLPLLIKE